MFLLKILQESLSMPVSNFKNSIEVVKKLNNIHIPVDHVLVSLDFFVYECSHKLDHGFIRKNGV